MLSIRDSEMQKQAKAHFEAEMKKHLANKPELADKCTSRRYDLLTPVALEYSPMHASDP